MESFSSIVVCIEYGRLVFDNLKKTVLYLLPAGTFCELWPILLTIFFGLPQMLSAIEMIIISMLTDCGASMSLIKEKPEADLLLRMPRRPEKDRLANGKLLFQAYCFIGLPMMVCANALAFRVFSQAGIPFSSLWMSFGNIQINGVPVDPILYENTLYQAQSTYFVTLVLMQWANLLMTRTRRLSILQQPPIGPRTTRNLYIFIAMSFTISILVLFIFVTFFHNVFHTRAVTVAYWFIRISPPLMWSDYSSWIWGGTSCPRRDAEIFGASVSKIVCGQDCLVDFVVSKFGNHLNLIIY
jgi:sodium/potassium-transporting ATPase subunit alpha